MAKKAGRGRMTGAKRGKNAGDGSSPAGFKLMGPAAVAALPQTPLPRVSPPPARAPAPPLPSGKRATENPRSTNPKLPNLGSKAFKPPRGR